MNLIVKNTGVAEWNGRMMRCAVGRAGVVSADIKCEGDGATPIGFWKMREVIYRSDRLDVPKTSLPIRSMQPTDGWCDAAQDINYNRSVQHPYAASAEKMWRADYLYDIVVILGYNDDPPIAGKGSAIFLHLAPPDYSPSAGCITLAKKDLLAVLSEADATAGVEILKP